jgi:uncharacterized damage-inducible protein DinB
MTTPILPSLVAQFKYYQQLGDKAFAQVSDDKLCIQINEDTNSIATIVKHMHGNMLSRWTDFLTTDGEKDWRKRDEEFDNDIDSREKMLAIWKEGWGCLFSALESLNEKDFDEEIFIRNQGHTVAEAIFRQLAHYSYHVGQIVFSAKQLSTDSWNSLSIPKGKTNAYNAEKFASEKKKAHFTDEFLKGSSII